MIIFLNGTSSSGKSTLSLALQNRLGEGWLLFNMDGYMSMLGPTFWGLHPDNPSITSPNEICYAIKHAEHNFEIKTGKTFDKLFTTIPNVLDTIARQGFNIIVDSFILTNEEFNRYKQTLANYKPLFVYLHAPEDIINSREAARKDRLPGSAVHWLRQFECISACDLQIDTHATNVDEACQLIIERSN